MDSIPVRQLATGENPAGSLNRFGRQRANM